MTKSIHSLRQLFQAMEGWVLWVNPKGEIEDYNDAARRFFEQQPDPPRQIFEMVPTLSVFDWQQILEEIEGKNFYQSDEKIRTSRKGFADGQFMLAPYDRSTYLVLVRLLDNQSGAIQDVTAQPLLKLVNFTIDHSQNLIFWLREDASIFYANARVYHFLGYHEEELRQMKLTDLNPDLSMEAYQKYWSVVQTEGDLETEHSFYKKDGTSFEVEANLFFVRFQQEDYCCVFMRDISKRKAKEAELKEAMEKIQQLKVRLEEEKSYLKAEVSENYSFNNIISRSKNYRQVLNQVAQVADTDSTVLITGETGTGKELLARAIHGLSPREEQPLIKVNCAALPSQLIESELFGHEKGAFTGAISRKMGKFEVADGGTLFLDEIGEFPLELQAKLLRALQEGEIERVGNPLPFKVNVRIIAATNRNLAEMVTQNKFREDLYYRLNVFPIHNIPLRERPDDIPLLVQFFLEKYARKAGKQIEKIPKSALKALQKYNFPGNIRELENLVERAVIISNGNTLQLDAVIPQKRMKGDKKGFPTMEELQKRHIIQALKKSKGKVTGKNSASELLGMNGKTLDSRMRKWNIDRFDFLD